MKVLERIKFFVVGGIENASGYTVHHSGILPGGPWAFLKTVSALAYLSFVGGFALAGRHSPTAEHYWNGLIMGALAVFVSSILQTSCWALVCNDVFKHEWNDAVKKGTASEWIGKLHDYEERVKAGAQLKLAFIPVAVAMSFLAMGRHW